MSFYFAWVDPEGTSGYEVPVFGPEHLVEDEEIIRFTLEQREGDFAVLTIDVRNPRIGPLAPGRPLYAWFSYGSDSEVYPLFFGRLVGIPSNLVANILTYTLVARPPNFRERKNELAETLRVLPYYDEIFIDEQYRDDPDTVLEGYSAAWNIDRVSHEVTITDFLVGEDGVIDFDADAVIYDSVDCQMDRAPRNRVTVKGGIPWKQGASGTFSLGPYNFVSLTGTDGVAGWPKTGDSLAGGYYVVSADVVPKGGEPEAVTLSFNYTNREQTHRDGDVMSINESRTYVPGAMDIPLTSSGYSVNGDPHTGTPASAGRRETGMAIAKREITASMVLGVDANRDRLEDVTINLQADLQPVLSAGGLDDDDDNDDEVIELNAASVSECEDPTIGNAARGEYVTTDRGLQSIQYMINRGRSRLVLGARAVTVKWDCQLSAMVNLSCRNNARITDARLPGGTALGKVVYYSMRGDGDTGEFLGHVEIACAVGLGNAIEAADGTADYVDEDYVEDYQTFTGQIIALPTGDVGYGPPVLTGGGPSGMISLSKSNLVIREEIINSSGESEAELIEAIQPSSPIGLGALAYYQELFEEQKRRAAVILARTHSYVELELLDLTAAGVEAQWLTPTTALVIPRQIDLMAP